MQVIDIPAGSLAVMSGLPGAGKSHILRTSALPLGIVQSSDALRRTFGGDVAFYDRTGRLIQEPMDTVSGLVWKTLEAVVEERLKQCLTTIVDATLVADDNPGTADRTLFAKLAQKHGVPFKVIIVDTPLEQTHAQNSSRPSMVPAEVVEGFRRGRVIPANGKTPEMVHGAYRPTSRYPHEVVTSDARIRIVSPLQLQGSKWDVIGDVHGMLDELHLLLATLGYETDVDGQYFHPDGRRILFLGDLVDRGPKSLETLAFVRKLCLSGLALCVKGNHDEKLVQFWDAAKEGALETWKSFANAQTGMELLRMPEDEAAALVSFIRSMSVFATYEDEQRVVVFAHADARSFFLGNTPSGDLLHGCSDWGRFDSDAAMQKFLENVSIHASDPGEGLPAKTQYFVRGHIPGTSWQPNVVSLEAHAFQNGSLLAMRLDDFVEGKSALVPQPCEYDHNARQEARVGPYKELQALVAAKLAVVNVQPNYGLRLFKYSKSVFYDHLWSTNATLLRARGHVYDVAGNLVSNPFDKVFNYREEGAGDDLAETTPVRAVVKLNGFLGVVSPHPVLKGDVLVHSSGSFDSQFVGYIRQYITPAVKGRMLRLFSKRRLTLMFEVLHPEDPHIIPYGPEDHGLYLIGAREIAQGSPLLRESELDELAQELGLRRPEHFVTTFGELRKLTAECRHEGFMARLCDEQETMVLKLKGVFYLTTKFLSRMSAGNWKYLFANPKNFKTKIDEEFFPLVDALVDKHKLEQILEMDEQAKLALVRELVS